MQTKTQPKPQPTTVQVAPEAVPLVRQAVQAAYDGVREVRRRAVDEGASNAKTNDLGGHMHELHLVLEQLDGKRIFPDEAHELRKIRENLLAKLKEQNAKVERYESWLRSVASTELHGRMDGGDYTELAGGWQSEAQNLLAGRLPTATTHQDPLGAMDQDLNMIMGKKDTFDIQSAHQYLMLIGQRLYLAAEEQGLEPGQEEAPLENAIETLRAGYTPEEWAAHGLVRFS